MILSYLESAHSKNGHISIKMPQNAPNSMKIIFLISNIEELYSLPGFSEVQSFPLFCVMTS